MKTSQSETRSRSMHADSALARLQDILSAYDSLAIAVSGGVDSVTLATVAHDVLGGQVVMVHAVSPAVPPEATQRVRSHALAFGWTLQVVNADEFADERYRKNPVNRCYYCKSNLYNRVREVWQGRIASGANLDDLGDYRPGLLAASENSVVHPLVDARIDKAGVRRIALNRGLDTVAELPAQPCLSSRIETGISIDAGDLLFVHKIEQLLTRHLGAGDIRCRITASGVRVEVVEALQHKDAAAWARAQADVVQLINASGRILSGFSGYQRGSAFLTGT